MSKQRILQTLKQEIARETGLPVGDIHDDASFFSLGLNSISAVYILDNLEKKLAIEMSPMFFWEFPTVELLAQHLSSLAGHE